MIKKALNNIMFKSNLAVHSFLHSFLFVGLGSALSAFCTHVALCSYIF